MTHDTAIALSVNEDLDTLRSSTLATAGDSEGRSALVDFHVGASADVAVHGSIVHPVLKEIGQYCRLPHSPPNEVPHALLAVNDKY
jgi:hypothetical protein